MILYDEISCVYIYVCHVYIYLYLYVVVPVFKFDDISYICVMFLHMIVSRSMWFPSSTHIRLLHFLRDPSILCFAVVTATKTKQLCPIGSSNFRHDPQWNWPYGKINGRTQQNPVRPISMGKYTNNNRRKDCQNPISCHANTIYTSILRIARFKRALIVVVGSQTGIQK